MAHLLLPFERLYLTCCWYMTTWNRYINSELKVAFPDICSQIYWQYYSQHLGRYLPLIKSYPTLMVESIWWMERGLQNPCLVVCFRGVYFLIKSVLHWAFYPWTKFWLVITSMVCLSVRPVCLVHSNLVLASTQEL